VNAAGDVIGGLIIHHAGAGQEENVQLGHPDRLGIWNQPCGEGCETDALHAFCRRFLLLFGEADQPHLVTGHQLLKRGIDSVRGPVFAVADDLTVLYAFHRVTHGTMHQIRVDVEHRHHIGRQGLGGGSPDAGIELLPVQFAERRHARLLGYGNQQD